MPQFRGMIITIAQVLKEMETGQPFTLSCVTYDRKRKSGGQLLEGEGQLLMADADGKEPGTSPTDRPPTDYEAKLAALADGPASRNPNHRKWYTRNIRLLADGHPTGEIRTVHPPLFIEFNGRVVVP